MIELQRRRRKRAEERELMVLINASNEALDISDYECLRDFANELGWSIGRIRAVAERIKKRKKNRDE